jgi:hypothetical protein
MKDYTAAEIVDLIRTTNPDGSPALSKSEAALLISLFTSAAIARAERNQMLSAFPKACHPVLKGARAS